MRAILFVCVTHGHSGNEARPATVTRENVDVQLQEFACMFQNSVAGGLSFLPLVGRRGCLFLVWCDGRFDQCIVRAMNDEWKDIGRA